MQASQEVKDWISKERKRRGKKNGVIPFLWDDIGMELRDINSKKNYSRKGYKVDFEQ